jgi:hypothetical protein
MLKILSKLFIILLATNLYSKPLVLIRAKAGENKLHHGSSLPYWGGSIEYTLLPKISFSLSSGFQYYSTFFRYDTMTYGFDVNEIPVDLGVKYTFLEFAGIKLIAQPQLGFLCSGNELQPGGELVPGEVIDRYEKTEFFITLSPAIGIHYSIPTTNLWLGFDLHFNHHFNYRNKKGDYEENDYFRLTYSFAFELFQR